MANKTKLRLNQISGSLGQRTGGNGTENAFTFAAGTDNAIYINMDTRNTNLLTLGSANVGVVLDGALSGAKIGKSQGQLVPVDAGAALGANEFVRVHGSNNTLVGVAAADVRTAISAQPLDAQLTDVAGLAVGDGNFIVGDGSNFIVESGATARTSLGLGDAAVLSKGISANNLLQVEANLAQDRFLMTHGSNATVVDKTAAQVLSTIGAQPADAQLTDVAGLAVGDGNFIVGDGSNFIVESGATARSSLGAQAALASIGSAVSINNQKLSSLGTPTVGTDAATKAYVDSVAAGLRWLAPADIATTAELNTNAAGVTYVDNDNALKKATNGALGNIDNEPVQFDNNEANATRILVKDQAGVKGFVQFSVDTVPAAGENMTFELNDLYYQINFSTSNTDNTWGGGNGSNSGARKTFNIKQNNGGESETTIASAIKLAFGPEFNISTSGANEVVKLEQTHPQDQAVTNNVAGTAGTDNESQAAGVSSRNGIYWAYADGSGGAPWELRRATDAIDMTELSSAAIFVQMGAAGGDQGFVQSVDLDGGSNTDDSHQNWVQFTGGAALVGDKGVDKTGTTISLDMNTLTAATVDVAADSIAIIDANDSNKSRKESISDLVAGMIAGSNGLSASSGVASVALKTNGGLGLDSNDIRLDFSNTANANGQLAIAQGGTGRAALTAGFALLGDGTSAVAMVDATADGAFLVGNGSVMVAESGATARTSLGLGSAAVLNSGISANNLLKVEANLAQNRFLMTHASNATIIDQTAAQVLATIGAQASNAKLTDIAGLNLGDGNFIVGDGSNFIVESGATARASLGAQATLTFGIGNGNSMKFAGDANAADNEFLHVKGTDIESLSYAEVKSLLGLTNAAAATQKATIEQAAALGANADLAIPTGGGFHTTFAGATSVAREIYLNGQLLLEGDDVDANKDWYESDTANNVKFEFGIEIGDVIQFVVRA